MTDTRAILATKRDGGELSEGQIRDFINGYVEGTIPDYMAAALLTGIFIHGMGDAELECWTRAMLHSGSTFDFSDLDKPKADKHSTGGVGDKVSIPLAPAVAACGVAVPMISGRGLAHTGGTLDKLEAIPGFRTDLDEAAFRRCLANTGVAFGAQTPDIVPADRKLYALRDVTGLVASIPLIASSILSKKLAEGIDALVLDVKFGSGAFLTDPERGAELGRTMIRIASSLGVPAVVWQTSMERPLGHAVGHVTEIAESLDCLRGAGPDDLRELVVLLGGEMLSLAGQEPNLAAGRERIAGVLDDGSALEVFRRVVTEQGGDAASLDDPGAFLPGPDEDVLVAAKAGRLVFRDVQAVGHALCALGGGRARLEDDVDPEVALTFEAQAGQQLAAGDPICRIHHRAGRGLERARALLGEACHTDPDAAAPAPLVMGSMAAPAPS
ncbi:MAG: thymidine phosphorylase [Planctomycetota bacterium]|jgi:pyrimidine-nucleoside phosphorylase|nr:thymidine phosphorylase [Planctomycetota bacterium]MDP6838096.1 thymidine phosphorylase [Planctomycetota bacterium]